MAPAWWLHQSEHAVSRASQKDQNWCRFSWSTCRSTLTISDREFSHPHSVRAHTILLSKSVSGTIRNHWECWHKISHMYCTSCVLTSISSYLPWSFDFHIYFWWCWEKLNLHTFKGDDKASTLCTLAFVTSLKQNYTKPVSFLTTCFFTMWNK